MSFLYPRTVSLYRDGTPPAGQSGFGAQPFQEPQTVGGVNIWSSVPIFTGIACSIQFERAGQQTTENLPGSARNIPRWKIYTPLGALQRGAVLFRDFLLDDLGRKFIVYAVDPEGLGFLILATSLEV